MIDIELIDEPVNLDEFQDFKCKKPCLFLGYIIKNEYDNIRLELNEKYNPKKYVHVYLEKGKKFNILPLYGLFLDLNDLGKTVGDLLVRQEKTKSMNMIIYENLLNQHNLSCDDCYGNFHKNVYPVDFKHFDKLSDESIAKDKKILQHLLQLEENKFDFQKFGSIVTLILT